MYRNNKILDAARGQRCTLRTIYCNHDWSTTVACHLPKHIAGGGMGIKPPDYAVVFACSRCHDALDGRISEGGELAIVDPDLLLRAYVRTIGILIEEGIWQTSGHTQKP